MLQVKPATHGRDVDASFRHSVTQQRMSAAGFRELMPQMIDGHLHRIYRRRGIMLAVRDLGDGSSELRARRCSAQDPNHRIMEALGLSGGVA